ncbi:hypothetical protein ACERII_11695 [Evansella sp. AB-rgal1]|uniref:hypothetical protein n=1 Tax=Evansella sp. AB-rgal1 TaxID=3242696 RepID=UPI00359DA92B
MLRFFHRQAIIAGVIAGIILGLLFKVMEEVWSIKVYTLLLNIDYFPIIKDIPFPEVIEFSFHMIVSVLLSCMIRAVLFRKEMSYKAYINFIVFLCFLIGLILFPTTALSTRTPPITQVEAWICWLLGHVLYGYVLSRLLLRKKID